MNQNVTLANKRAQIHKLSDASLGKFDADASRVAFLDPWMQNAELIWFDTKNTSFGQHMGFGRHSWWNFAWICLFKVFFWVVFFYFKLWEITIFRFGGLPSLKLTYPLKIDPWKRRFLLETIIFRRYVSFREGICFPFSSHHSKSKHKRCLIWFCMVLLACFLFSHRSDHRRFCLL